MPRSSRLPVNPMEQASFKREGILPDMAISDWPLAERPRERLLAEGAKVLSDAELLAVLLRTGLRGKSAVDLARDLLKKYKGIAAMLEASDLETVSGLGPAKRAQFAAAIELSRR